jgi:hypothetical protein
MGVRDVLCCATLLAALGGCARGPYAVAGKVVIEGEPGPTPELKDYLVTLQSVSAPIGANGTVQEDGSFTVGTHQAGDGAMPGRYKVSIMSPIPSSPEESRARSILDPKYERFETSGLEVEIKPQRNDVTLTVQRRRK